MYVTWYELVEFLMALITLAFVIMSYLNSKKDNRPTLPKFAVIF